MKKLILVTVLFFCVLTSYCQSHIGKSRQWLFDNVEGLKDTVEYNTNHVLFKVNTGYVVFYLLDSCNICKQTAIYCTSEFYKNLYVKSFDMIHKKVGGQDFTIWFDEYEQVYIYLLYDEKYYYFLFSKD